ncbi:MAG: isochorismate synthase [Nitriliruptorales bacterium]|nr:isochorismate synthase [Nitriliruptorales bacterium]
MSADEIPITWQVTTTPLASERSLVDHAPADALVWLHGDDGLVAWGEAMRLPIGVSDLRMRAFASALAAIQSTVTVEDDVGLPGSGLVAFASATFDLEGTASVGIIPRRIVGRRDGVTWTTMIDPIDAPPFRDPPSWDADVATDRPRFAGSSIPDAHWLVAVHEALDQIRGGHVTKVVLARDHAVWSHEPFDTGLLVRRLHERFAGCFTFHVDGLVGASPELLVRRFGRDITSEVFAGTASRSDDATADERLAQELAHSDKNLREHALARESVATPLGELCDDLDVPPTPQLRMLANVHHLATRITGRLRADTSVGELVDLLHPTAAVGGTPRFEAVELLRRLEGMDRGRYAGPVGWLDSRGDGEFAIALRCAELSGARARLFAGAGVVEGSLPEDELEETRLKLLAMRGVMEAE